MMPYYVGIDGGGTKTAVELRTRGSAAHSRAGNVFAEKDDVADLIFFDHLHQLRCEGGSGKASDKALADTFKVCHV